MVCYLIAIHCVVDHLYVGSFLDGFVGVVFLCVRFESYKLKTEKKKVFELSEISLRGDLKI